MNFKKIVSAFSALAISVSAFAGLTLTANAAVTAYTQNYEATNATADWTTGTSDRYTPIILPKTDGNHFLTVNQDQRANNGTTLTSTSISGKAAAGDNFTFSCDLKLGSHSDGSQNSDGTPKQGPASFNIYDASGSTAILTLADTDAFATTWKINGNDNQIVSLSGTKAGNTIDNLTWYSIKLTRSGNNEYLTITNKSENEYATLSDGTTKVNQLKIATLSADGGLGNMTFGTSRYNANFAIDNVNVAAVADGDVPTNTADYTVKYVDENSAELKDSATYSGTIGESISLTDADKASFYNSDNTKKYVYLSDDSADKTVTDDGNTVVTVTFKEAGTYTATLNKTVNGVTSVISTTNVFEGDTWSYTFPRYQQDGTTVYEAEANSGNPNYGGSVSNVAGNVEATIEYTKATYENVAFFVDLDGSTDKYADDRASNGSAYNNAAFTSTTDLEPGTYTFYVRFSYIGRGSSLKVGDTTVLDASTTKKNAWTNSTIENVNVTEASKITWNPGSSNTYDPIDTILVVKTAELPYDITATHPENGTLTVSPTTAAEGETVTITATANTGYEVKSVSATAGGTEIAVTKVTDGTYTFTMPASAVTVSAVIEAIPTTPDPSATFETISESEKVGNIYNVGFLSTINALENNADWTVKEVGFTFANIDDESVSSGQVKVSDKALTVDEAFSYIFQNIPDSYTGFGIFAVPYIVFAKEGSDNVTVQGEAVNGSNTAFKAASTSSAE